MRIRVFIGDAEANHGQPIAPEFVADLDPKVREHLLRPEGFCIPWDLALSLLDAYDHDIGLNSVRLPSWLDEDAAESVQDLVIGAGLPPTSRFRLRLRASPVGRVYQLEASWTDAEGLSLDTPPRVRGGLLEHPTCATSRLTAGQFGALTALAGAATPRSRDEALTQLERVKTAVPENDPGVLFDGFLERETVVTVDAIKPRMVPVQGGKFQVRPVIPGVAKDDLDDYYFKTPAAAVGHRALTIRGEEAERTRVLFSDRARAAMLDLRRINVLGAAEVARALSRPEEVFGANLDLSDFSDRVSGIGPDIRRALPAAQRVNVGDWWAWDLDLTGLGEGDEPALSLDLRDSETVTALALAIKTADEQGLRYIPHPNNPGVLLEVDAELRQAVERATAEPPEEIERVVLQVRDNIEDIEHDESSRASVTRPTAWVPPPGLLPRFDLQTHQREGYDWLRQINQDEGHRGAILADDMGLGKTIQVLAHLDYLASIGRPGPHLIVTPVALADNWRTEARKFFGDALEPFDLIERPLSGPGAIDWLQSRRLVVVGYERLLRSEVTFARVRWDTIALDEAQKSKNPDTQIARCLRTLQARFRLCVSGTPVENRLRELWTLYDWAVPGLLGSLSEFRRDFIEPATDPEGRVALAERLIARIGPVFIRRMKSQLPDIQLPTKSRADLAVPLSDEQYVRYGRAIAAVEAKKKARLGALSLLFGVCAHPSMADPGELPPYPDVSFPKADRLFAVLDEIRTRDEKALVFATRKRIQRWIAASAARRYGKRPEVINGSISGSSARLAIVDRFSHAPGFGVLVLAPRAAGVGLNITAANHVIHYMREWNPAIEAQATDRAYRIGQAKDVRVYTITAEGRGENETVEQRLDRLLSKKRELMETFVVPLGGFEVSADEILRG